MSDRWSLKIEGIDSGCPLLVAKPTEGLFKFVQQAINELAKRCALAEEHLIFQGCSDEVLGRIKTCCEHELRKRKDV